jgi:hypothetical protein
VRQVLQRLVCFVADETLAAERVRIFVRYADRVVRFQLVDGRIDVAGLAEVFQLDRGLVLDGNYLRKTNDGLRCAQQWQLTVKPLLLPCC